ncbi:MATE family efflux transporter [Paenibacillus sp. J2TS4]|uniref:MATE family efflux transporter n=1 Tax=Paenibacillus sp. J2TS4 TaxID=2807194 RepID=UPI001B0CDFEA|nr:MATE family efflux transporter [Paenibacillus sp. J2TS4]GIP35730.1 MATE efflux family protein [Paenibacillus sp. J2TS4]
MNEINGELARSKPESDKRKTPPGTNPEHNPFTEVDIDDPKAVRKRILQLAGPSLVEMLLLNLVQMLNMIMVGRVGAEAVAAVGLTNQPFFLLLAIFMTLNVGTTVIVARSIGSGEVEEANRAAGQAFLLNIVISVIVILFSFLYAEEMLVLMGASPEVLVEGVAYAKIIFLSIGFTTVSMSLSAILRGAGNTKTPMKINVLSNALVVIIGFPLIYGLFGFPRLGVVGAAVSTMIANFTAMTWVVYVLFSGQSTVRLTLKSIFRFDSELIRRILKIGLPAAGEQFAMRGGQLIFSKVVAGLGTLTFAANQIAFSILGLTFMPGMAFSLVATTMVGQSLGAGKPELAEKFGWEIRKLGVIVAASLGVGFILFAPYIMMPYTNDPEIIRQGSIALRVVGFVQVSQATQFILAGALRGAGDTKFPLYSTFIGVWGFRVILSLIFVLWFEWGILGAWLGIAADQIIRSFLIYRRYKSGKWKSISM